MPPYAKSGDWVKYRIKLLEVWNPEEYTQAKEEAKRQFIMDQGTVIQEHLAQKGITSYGKTASGLFYVMHTEGSGAPPAAGATVNVHYIGTLLDGTKFDSSRDRNQPFSFVVGKGQVIKGWDEGLTLFKPGGRGTLYIPSPLAYGENGAGAIPPNAILVFDIELLSVSDASLVLENDVQTILDYLMSQGIHARKAQSGLFYTIDREGSGPNPLPGNMITVHYTGKLLNGTKFDSSYDRGEPISFKIGSGQVIKGWDLGLRNFNKGSKGTLYIPSALGYGERGAPPAIPGKAILVFDIEVIDIK
jgi:peptidylprolyl isomerase